LIFDRVIPLNLKKLEIFSFHSLTFVWKFVFENCVRAKKKKTKKNKKQTNKQILCHGIEPNPSKDRAMHDGDNPSF
jgi:hypothetical protein